MKVKLKVGEDNTWGFVEEFTKYRYLDEGYVDVVVGISPTERTFTEPFVYKGGNFVGLKEVHDTVGVDRYIKAKKPFYSLIEDGFIVALRAGVNYVTGEYCPKKSSFTVYTLNEAVEAGMSSVALRPLLDVPTLVVELLESLLPILGETLGDREKFLLSRIKG